SNRVPPAPTSLWTRSPLADGNAENALVFRRNRLHRVAGRQVGLFDHALIAFAPGFDPVQDRSLVVGQAGNDFAGPRWPIAVARRGTQVQHLTDLVAVSHGALLFD